MCLVVLPNLAYSTKKFQADIQSTNISVGPPDRASWWSGGLLGKLNSIKTLIGTNNVYAFISYSLLNCMYSLNCNDCSNALYKKR